MRPRPLSVAAIAVLLVICAGIYAARNMVVTTSITAFAVDDDDARTGPWLSRLANATATRTMIVTFGGAAIEQAHGAASNFAAALADHPEVESVRTGPDPALGERLFDAVWARRMRFAIDHPQEAKLRFSDEALARDAARLRTELARPTGTAIKRLAPRDPWLVAFDTMAEIRDGAGGDVVVDDGHFATADRSWSVVFLTTRHGPFEATAQGPLEDVIASLVLEIGDAHGVTIERTVLHRLAVTSERSIRAEVGVLSTASSVGVLAVLLLAFWRPRILVLTMVPMAAGVAIATAATLAIRGEIHGLTLAFGTTLVGVCVDYPIHLATHHAILRDRNRALAVTWPGLVLGALTTVAGFAAIAAFGLPGVRELGLFAAIGVTVALGVTRWVVAPLLPASTGGGMPRWETAIERFVATASSRPWLAITLVAASLLAAAGLLRATWVDDPRVLGISDPAMTAEDERVRARVGGSDVGRVIISEGRDRDDAIAVQEAVFDRLQTPSDREGADRKPIARSAASLLRSRARQDESLAAVRAMSDLGSRTVAALVDAGFRREAFDALDTTFADDPGPLDEAALAAAGLDELVRPFEMRNGDTVALLAFVPQLDPTEVATAVGEVPGATYLDQRAFLARIYREHREQTTHAIVVGVVVIMVLLAGRYRSARATIAAAGPAVIAALASLGALAWAGQPLNMLHLVGGLLVLSMGVDYGVFLVENHHAGHARGPAVTGVALACLTTVVAFGVLATSSTGALAAVGATTAIGVALAAVLAPLSVVR